MTLITKIFEVAPAFSSLHRNRAFSKRLYFKRSALSFFEKIFLIGIVFSLLGLFFLSERWVIFSLLSTLLLGGTILFDMALFKTKIFQNSFEPFVITGILQLLPWMIVPFIAFVYIEPSLFFLAFSAGVLNMVGLWFYFKSVHFDQDGVTSAVLWNLLIVVVPIFSFFILQEKFLVSQYFGIFLLFFGAGIILYQKMMQKKQVVFNMLLAIFFVAVSVVIMKSVFTAIPGNESSIIFWSGFLPFILGEGVLSLVVLFVGKKFLSRLLGIWQAYWWIFLFIEGLQVLAEVSESYAMTLGPVSMVIAMEGLIGVFVILIALIVFYMMQGTKKESLWEKLKNEQLSCMRSKTIGIILVVVGAYFIS